MFSDSLLALDIEVPSLYYLSKPAVGGGSVFGSITNVGYHISSRQAARFIQVYYLLHKHQTSWLIQRLPFFRMCLMRASSETLLLKADRSLLISTS